MPRPFSLRSLVAIALGLLSVLAIAAAVATTERAATREARKAATEGVTALASILRYRLDRGVFERFRDIVVASSLNFDTSGSAGDWRRIVQRLRGTYPDYVWIGVADAEGRVVASTDRLLEGSDVSERDWFKEGLRGPFVGEVHDAEVLAGLLPGGGDAPLRLLDLAAPIFDPMGQVSAVLGAHLNWRWIDDALTSTRSEWATDMEIFLINAEGVVVASTKAEELKALNARRAAFASGDGDAELAFWRENGRYIAALSRSEGHRFFKGVGWKIVVRQLAGSAFAPVNTIRQELIGVGIFMSLLFVVAGWLLAAMITRPLRIVSSAADKLRAGETDVVIPSPGRFAELVSLTGSLQALIDELTQREATIRARGSEIERRQRFLTAILTGMQDALFVAKDGALVFANEACLALFAVADEYGLIGRPPLALFRSRERDLIAERINGTSKAEGRSPPMELEIIRFDGTTAAVEFLAAGFIDETGPATLVMLRDITAKKRTERQLQRAQRLEAVGQLTGGMAHDFNNLLSVIVGNLELLEAQLGDDADARELADAAMHAALRGGELTRQLLAFSRRQPLEPKVFDLNALASETTKLLRRTLGKRVVVRLSLADGLWPVVADPTQLESALLNLAINARDAMPDGGTLTIETGNRRIDERDASENVEVAQGDYVMLAVSDTGTGMPPEIIDRVFEPFFTTKPEGEGTGLGLAMIYGFTKQSRGHVRILSEVGQGTTVQLFFPRAAERRVAAADLAPAKAEDPADATILVVDDNEPLRNAASRILSALGYQVLGAGTAADALEILRDDRPINLLFTDLEMPGGMRGERLAAEAKRLRPQLKVLFTTGSADPPVMIPDLPSEVGPHAVLAKPYRRDELARLVAEQLGQH